MQIFKDLTYINNSSLALGYFDGLHIGHNVVLKNAIHVAQKNNTKSTVITFKSHPLNYIKGKDTKQILTLDERLDIIKNIGINNVVILDFKDIASIKAEDYLKNVLVKYFSPIAITTGFNHSFGFNKKGNCVFLKKNQAKYGYKYYEIPPCTINENIISCSAIKKKLSEGNFFDANKMLGYYFFIKGEVIEGDRMASKLGFASANINYPDIKVKIPYGVYFVKVKVNNEIYNGILNYGASPTFNKTSIVKTEVHIINFNKDIYGKEISIFFVSKIREQIKFLNTDKLKEQIVRDIAFTNIQDKFILFGHN